MSALIPVVLKFASRAECDWVMGQLSDGSLSPNDADFERTRQDIYRVRLSAEVKAEIRARAKRRAALVPPKGSGV